jgi:tetratricopeptide (TPR) repeat protein
MSLEKRPFIGALLGFVCVGLLVAGPASAQDWKGQGRLAGAVSDEDGNAIEGATVKLELPGRGGPDPLTTDEKGEWAILGLAGGRWNVDIGKEGYVTRSMFANVRQGRHLPPVKTTLEKAAPVGPPPEVMEAIEKGDKAYQEGRYAEARVEYEKLLGMRPDLSESLLMQIAHCYKQEGNVEKELEYLERLLAENPENAQVRTLMALEAVEAGMSERADELLAQIDDATIENPDIWYNIGVSFRNQNRPDEAITYFTKAVALKPDYVDGYFQRALTYFGAERFAECRADFEKVVELAPEGAQAETATKVLQQLPAPE